MKVSGILSRFQSRPQRVFEGCMVGIGRLGSRRTKRELETGKRLQLIYYAELDKQ